MADSKISDLTDGTAPDDADEFVAARSGTTIKLPWSAMKPVTVLYDELLASAQATIDSGAGGFSTDYAHLMIVFYGRTTEAVAEGVATMRVNNDSGANYDEQDIRVINTTASGALTLGGTSFNLRVLGASAGASRFAQHEMLIASYADTNAFKTVTGGYVSISGTAATCRTGNKSGLWRSTSAITRVAITAGSGNLVAGSRMTVYGLE